MPLRRRNGEFFGTLCALDPAAATLPADHLGLFGLIAELIAYQLEAEERHDQRGRALQDAEEAVLFRDRFVAILGHDLRNPLGAVQNAAALLLTRDDLPPAHSSIVRRIARSAARMSEIISAVLDTVRGRFGMELPVRPARCDAAAMVRQVVEELALVHAGREIEVDAPSDLPVVWDCPRVAQIVSNLIGNALQYSPGGSVVRVSLGQDSGWVTIAVRNSGPTIRPEDLQRLFEPFRREGPGGRGHGGGGLGLGLYISRGIASAHGGTIDVASVAGTTTFTVRLPAALLDEVAVPDERARPSRLTAPPA